MITDSKSEKLLEAWITLNGLIKNSRITNGLHYNEAIIMNFVYKRYLSDETGLVSIKEIIQKTRMLKSLVNRTVNNLIDADFLERCEHEGDRRLVYVKCCADKADVFLKIHSESLAHAERIMNIIGEEDTESFLRIVEKIEKSGYSL